MEEGKQPTKRQPVESLKIPCQNLMLADGACKNRISLCICADVEIIEGCFVDGVNKCEKDGPALSGGAVARSHQLPRGACALASTTASTPPLPGGAPPTSRSGAPEPSTKAAATSRQGV